MPDVDNPGDVNVADQSFGGLPVQVPAIGSVPASASDINRTGSGGHRPFVVDQEITVSTPASTAVDTARAGDASQELAVPSVQNQPVTVTTPGPPLTMVQGGSFQPGNGQVTTNQVNFTAGQTFGNGLPTNVYV